MQLSMVFLLVVAVGITSAQAGVVDPTEGERWVWGRRSQPTDTSVVAKTLHDGSAPPSLHRAQRRRGRVIGTSVLDTTNYKSISARSYPATAPLGVANAVVRRGKPGKVEQSIRTSVNPTFASHFDVFTQKDSDIFKKDIKKIQPKVSKFSAHDVKPGIITIGEYPYPFGARPIDLGDGTSIGWAPEDTLLVQSSPAAQSPAEKFPTLSIADQHDARYTTLDKLFDSRTPTKLPDTNSLPTDVLGGLHPDEVYYADKDLVIIKGGGFTTRDSFDIQEDLNDINRGSGNSFQTAHTGNELGEANDVQVTHVRVNEQFNRVPLPFRFVNGNIPTIVKTPFTAQPHRPNRTQRPHNVRPIHQTSFVPIIGQSTNSQIYVPSPTHQLHWLSTQNLNTFPSANSPTRNYQPLDEIMLAQPSVSRVQTVLPTSKRSTDSNVVHYNYQTRGHNARPIVDYRVHRENSNGLAITTHQHEASRRIHNSNQNVIQIARKESLEQGKRPNNQHSPHHQVSEHSQRENFERLEDLSIPGGVNVLIPKVQTPRRRPSFHQFPNSATQGSGQGTSVPQQQHQNNPSTHFVPTIHQQHQNTRPSHHQSPTPQFSRPPATQKPISLLGDTRVNFLPPLPPVNPQAEFLARRHAVAGGGNRDQVRVPSGQPRPGFVRTRGSPVTGRVRPQGQFRPSNVDTSVRRYNSNRPRGGVATARQNGRRFMEPRRRQQTRQRQVPRI